VTYHISVEPLAGTYYPILSDQSDLDAAKRVAQRAFRLGGCRTVAVIKIGDKPERQIIDIFDGEWLSVAVMGEAVEQRGRHLWVAEDAWPFTEGEVGGDDD
jgi:hypothetical protein